MLVENTQEFVTNSISPKFEDQKDGDASVEDNEVAKKSGSRSKEKRVNAATSKYGGGQPHIPKLNLNLASPDSNEPAITVNL